MERLPYELLTKIYLSVPTPDLYQSVLTCSTISNLISDDAFWYAKAKQTSCCIFFGNLRSDLSWRESYLDNYKEDPTIEYQRHLCELAECGEFDRVQTELSKLDPHILDLLTEPEIGIQIFVSLSIIGLRHTSTGSEASKKFVKYLWKKYHKISYLPNIFYGNDDIFCEYLDTYHVYRFKSDDEVIYWIQKYLKYTQYPPRDFSRYIYINDEVDEIIEAIFENQKQVVTPKLMKFFLDNFITESQLKEYLSDAKIDLGLFFPLC